MLSNVNISSCLCYVKLVLVKFYLGFSLLVKVDYEKKVQICQFKFSKDPSYLENLWQTTDCVW